MEIKLIDLSSIFRQHWAATSAENQNTAFGDTIASIHRITGGVSTNVAICCDGRGNWRKDLSPSYKANREKQAGVLYAQLDRVKQRLRDDGYLLWECDGFEADDVIATASDAAIALNAEVLIASADKDLLQLVTPTCRALRTHTGEVYGVDEVTAKMGVPPSRVGMWLALVGDKSDNVAGCPGVGAKTAAQLIAQCPSWGELWAAASVPPGLMPNAGGKQSAIGKALIENRAQIELAAKLVALKYDAPIAFDEITKTRVAKPLLTEEEPEMPHDMTAVIDAAEERTERVEPPVHDRRQIDQFDFHVTTPFFGTSPANGAPFAAPPAKAEIAQAAPTTAIAKSAPNDLGAMFGHDMRPTKMDGMWWLARRLFESQLYQQYGKPEAILAVMLTGLEIGISPMASVQPGTFSMIQGRPCPGAHLLIAKAQQDPDCEYFRLVSSDDKQATYETKHRKHPDPTSLTFTVEEAARAGLTNAQWKSRPAVMIRKTCGVQLARIVYPGALIGLYAAEEMS